MTLTTSPNAKSGLNWSPDGRKIAYVSQGSIWTISLDGGQPRRLTHAAAGEGDPRQAADRQPQWSPKGTWILFETGRRGHNDLVAVSEDGRSENFLSRGTGDSVEGRWSPDGKQIAYVERTKEFFSGRLNVVAFNTETGQAADPKVVYTAKTDRGGGWSLRTAAWSPDAKTLALVLEDGGWNHVYLMAAAGGAPKQLTQGEFEDMDPSFSPDGKSLAIISSRHGLEQAHIWVVPTTGGEARELVQPAVVGIESAPEWSPDSKEIFFHRNTPLESTDLFVARVGANEPAQQLTQTLPRDFAGALEMPEKVEYKSKDGLAISGILYKPHHFKAGTRYPAVLWIHGGPEAEDVFRLDLWAQYLAQQGYLVLEPNYRGSTGYGEKFRNLNVEDSGGGELEDVAAGAQYLVSQGWADAKRLAIGGGSHGGTMVAYAVTKYPDLFAAAIELFGVVDRAVFVERTNRNSAVRWMMKMGGTPDEKPDVYRKANALLDVDKIKTPLLVMHGENDPQVPPYESALFTRALKEHGKVFYYYTYPNELHGFSQREHRLDAWRKQLAFLQKYIQPAYGLSSSSVDDLLAPATPPPAGRSSSN